MRKMLDLMRNAQIKKSLKSRRARVRMREHSLLRLLRRMRNRSTFLALTQKKSRKLIRLRSKLLLDLQAEVESPANHPRVANPLPHVAP